MVEFCGGLALRANDLLRVLAQLVKGFVAQVVFNAAGIGGGGFGVHAQMLKKAGEEAVPHKDALGDGLSGGQKIKLMFLMMARQQPDVLLLDEPTRNLSPLSGPVVRELFASYPGCIIAVSHDRLFAKAVFTRAVELNASGLHHSTQFDS